MNITYCNDFWHNPDDEKSRVFEVYPNVYHDNRGFFLEHWSERNNQHWSCGTHWFKQINMSKSDSGVIRGAHAQRGGHCQAKMVCALDGCIYDVITDARPDSATFMQSKVFELSSSRQNKLFIPKGFLHTFVTKPRNGVFETHIFGYMCDEVYDHDSEINVNPVDLVQDAFHGYCLDNHTLNFVQDIEKFNMSEKDSNGVPSQTFFRKVQYEYTQSGKLWYRS